LEALFWLGLADGGQHADALLFLYELRLVDFYQFVDLRHHIFSDVVHFNVTQNALEHAVPSFD